MLVRKGIVVGCDHCFHAGIDHVESGGCVFCQCVSYQGDSTPEPKTTPTPIRGSCRDHPGSRS